jgi:hypothetical protein
MIFKIFLYFGFIFYIYGEVLPGCINLMCHTKIISPTAPIPKVKACDECRNVKTKFCGKFPDAIYCFNSIPNFCKPMSNLAQKEALNISNICYIPQKAFLPLPLFESNNHSLTIAIPRFNQQYRFHKLSLFLLFPISKGKNCSSNKIFSSRSVHKNRDCIWTIPIAMPTIDAIEAKNDPFYYDDQSDMSISFSPKIIPVADKHKISVWYSVNSDFIETHQNIPLNFSLPLYSYRKDVELE